MTAILVITDRTRRRGTALLGAVRCRDCAWAERDVIAEFPPDEHRP